MNIQRLSCLIELTTGTALLLTPGLAMTLIVGSSLPNGGNQMAQLFGAAIICLGLSCWSKDQATGRDVMPSIGLTTYNILSGLLLATSSPSQAMQTRLSLFLQRCFTSPLALRSSKDKSKGGVDTNP